MVEFMENAAAIIVEQGGLTSHAAIVGLHFDKPTKLVPRMPPGF